MEEQKRANGKTGKEKYSNDSDYFKKGLGKNMSKSDVSKVISTIIESKGLVILHKPHLFCAMLDDLAPQMINERNVFRRTLIPYPEISEKIYYLLDSEKTSTEDIGKLSYLMSNNYGISDKWVEIIIAAFWIEYYSNTDETSIDKEKNNSKNADSVHVIKVKKNEESSVSPKIQEEQRTRILLSNTIEEKEPLAPVRPNKAYCQGIIAAGNYHTIGVKPDGTVAINTIPQKQKQFVSYGQTYTIKLDFGQCRVSNWTDIVAVCANGVYTAGLKSDGSVVAVGKKECGRCDLGKNNCNRCFVFGWKNVIAIASGGRHMVGLKNNGTVVATGSNDSGQCDVSNWSDIIAVTAGYCHTVGLKADGTVVATGYNSDGQCNVSNWTDIVAIFATGSTTLGVKSNGKVLFVGHNYIGSESYSGMYTNVSKWTNIVAIAGDSYHTVGLKKDGTVVATGDNKKGQCNVSGWRNIVAVAAAYQHTVGLKADGTVVAVGNNECGQCNVSNWKLCTQKSDKKPDAKDRGDKRINQTANSSEDLRHSKIDSFIEWAEDFAQQKDLEKQNDLKRQQKIKELNSEKAFLQKELPSLKGLFLGKRRKEIEARIKQIDIEINKWSI